MFCLAIFTAIPPVPVSISLPGMIRPIRERTGMYSLIGGIIDSVYVREGQFIPAGHPVIQLKNYERKTQLDLLDFEIGWRREYIKDLKALCSKDSLSTVLQSIKNPYLRQQYSRFIYTDQEMLLSLNKTKKEFDMAEYLAREKVIAPKELFDKETEFNRLASSRKAFLLEQPILWEHDLVLKQQELRQFESRRSQLLDNDHLYLIKAPVPGVVQDIYTLYQGTVIQAGNLIGHISPETELVAECYASPKHIGSLTIGQDVRFQIEAYDYKHFGFLTGHVTFIDNDYTIVDRRPIYKIRCSLSGVRVRLNNGYAAHLKKGMTLTARFIITKRTLWQLLWDQLDDWLNPLNHNPAE